MERWYTLHTKANAEYQVKEVLEERGFVTYLPEITHPNESNGHKIEPFFPCYLFIRVNLKSVGLSHIQWTPGLRQMVAFDDQRPVPLADEIIDLIRHRVSNSETVPHSSRPDFKPGDTVQIVNGPFSDMLAVFDGPTTPAKRVQVLLDILGHASRVQVDVADLEKASPSPKVSKTKRPRRTRGRGRRIKNSQ